MNQSFKQERRRTAFAQKLSNCVATTAQRAIVLAMIAATDAALAGGGGDGGAGGPIQGVVSGVNIVLATVTAVCLAVATIGVGICGYKIIFDGATFRDVSNKLLGSAVCGSAGAIAAMFMTN
ncbi:MAG: TrbC/VirB2 family protein [Rhodocyclales bacterium]|nr:TrbC/VirB2 family protein [Rhodocyclales bacterium]